MQKNKKKTEEYHITLAERLVVAGVVDRENLLKIMSEVNVEYGMKSLSINSLSVMTDRISRVYGDDFERTKVGKRVLYSLKKVNKPRILNYFNPVGKTGIVTKQDIAHRDAYLVVAKKAMEKNPSLNRQNAVISAKNNVEILSEEMVLKAWNLIGRFKKMGDMLQLKKDDNVIFIQRVIETFKNYKVNLGFELVKKTLKLKRDKTKVMKEISDLGWNVLHIKLGTVKENEEKVVPLSIEESYMILVAGGMIKKNDGKFITIHQLIKVLKDNHYRKFDLSIYQVEEIFKKVPQYFNLKMSTKEISMEGNMWSKIYEEYAPKNQEWIVPWCINSDIRFEEIQKVFPESYQERKDINVGSRIIMIKADKSIKSFMKLARLSEKFRDSDFPIGENGLIERLAQESTYLEINLFNNMLGKINPAEWRSGIDPDKLLLQIEENCL